MLVCCCLGWQPYISKVKLVRSILASNWSSAPDRQAQHRGCRHSLALSRCIYNLCVCVLVSLCTRFKSVRLLFRRRKTQNVVICKLHVLTPCDWPEGMPGNTYRRCRRLHRQRGPRRCCFSTIPILPILLVSSQVVSLHLLQLKATSVAANTKVHPMWRLPPHLQMSLQNQHRTRQ